MSSIQALGANYVKFESARLMGSTEQKGSVFLRRANIIVALAAIFYFLLAFTEILEKPLPWNGILWHYILQPIFLVPQIFLLAFVLLLEARRLRAFRWHLASFIGIATTIGLGFLWSRLVTEALQH